jgi:hypothetical protein
MIAYLSFFGPIVSSFNNIYIKKTTKQWNSREGTANSSRDVYWAKVMQQLTLSRRYPQLVANRCCRLACLLLETLFVTRDVFCWENFFVMKGVREPRFHYIALGQVKQVLNTKAMLLHKQFYETFINSVNKPLTMIDQLHYVHNTSNLYPIWSKMHLVLIFIPY